MTTRRGARLRGTGLLAATIALTGCVTINVYFPEAQVQSLSEQIERRVQERAEQLERNPPQSPEERLEVQPSASAPDAAPRPAPGSDPSGLRLTILAAAAGGVAEPEILNPAIGALIESRARRLSELNRYKSLEVVGEGNDGLVKVRDLTKLGDLKARADVQRLVRDENADREQIFREIAAAKNVDASQLPRIRETYAETLREQARPGDWVQLPDGTWAQVEK